MTSQQREQLREVLIDYLQLLTSNAKSYDHNKIEEIRLLLREVA